MIAAMKYYMIANHGTHHGHHQHFEPVSGMNFALQIE